MKEVTREWLLALCDGKPFTLSDHADKVIVAINRRNGNCPCRSEEVPCPCPSHEEEIENSGKCHCSLFVKTS